MKKFTIFIATLILSQIAIAAPTNYNKGQLFVYWGWNGSNYTNSNLHLQGNDYNFTLHKIKATDRQSPFGWLYFDPSTITIPQYNFRVGYAFKDNWSLSIAMDHMKYVMVQNQQAQLTGTIQHPSAPIKGNDLNQMAQISPELLAFEHTDGLNNLNVELRHHKHLYHLALDKKQRGIDLSIEGGIGVGALIPRTNAQLFKQKRHDEFHLSGWDVHGTIGAKLTFWKNFFAMSEVKGGYINMPNIRTTYDKDDKASQSFGYFQYNIVFGVQFNLSAKS